jgi:C-terminal processing protease CtpA/Prc
MHLLPSLLLGFSLFLLQVQDPPAAGWLGIMLADRDQPTIAEVIPDSPAESAGLQVEDVILSVGGVAVPALEDFAKVFEGCKAGQKITLQLRRAGAGEGEERILTLEVVLAERPRLPEQPEKQP